MNEEFMDRIMSNPVQAQTQLSDNNSFPPEMQMKLNPHSNTSSAIRAFDNEPPFTVPTSVNVGGHQYIPEKTSFPSHLNINETPKSTYDKYIKSLKDKRITNQSFLANKQPTSSLLRQFSTVDPTPVDNSWWGKTKNWVKNNALELIGGAIVVGAVGYGAHKLYKKGQQSVSGEIANLKNVIDTQKTQFENRIKSEEEMKAEDFLAEKKKKKEEKMIESGKKEYDEYQNQWFDTIDPDGFIGKSDLALVKIYGYNNCNANSYFNKTVCRPLLSELKRRDFSDYSDQTLYGMLNNVNYKDEIYKKIKSNIKNKLFDNEL